MIAKVDRSEIYASVNYHVRVIYIISLLIIISAGAAIAFFQRSLRIRILTGRLENEERYHSTLDNMHEGCQLIGFGWKYLYINAAAEKHSRRPKGELLGKNYKEVRPDIENT